ncbi:MAG: sialic acid O-acetyltransferase [bacterium]
MIKQKVIIIGGKGTAINIAEQIIDAHKNYGVPIEFIGWANDDETIDNIINYPIVCRTDELNEKYNKYSDVKVIYSLYKPKIMKERCTLLKKLNIDRNKFTKFIHPTSFISPSAIIGLGSVILANSSILSDVTIGNYSIINTNVVVEHETKIDECVFIAASACIGSCVTVKKGTFIGLNSAIKENCTIEQYSVIGMGSNVVKSIKKNTTVIGNPAKPL